MKKALLVVGLSILFYSLFARLVFQDDQSSKRNTKYAAEKRLK